MAWRRVHREHLPNRRQLLFLSLSFEVKRSFAPPITSYSVLTSSTKIFDQDASTRLPLLRHALLEGGGLPAGAPLGKGGNANTYLRNVPQFNYYFDHFEFIVNVQRVMSAILKMHYFNNKM